MISRQGIEINPKYLEALCLNAHEGFYETNENLEDILYELDEKLYHLYFWIALHTPNPSPDKVEIYILNLIKAMIEEAHINFYVDMVTD